MSDEQEPSDEQRRIDNAQMAAGDGDAGLGVGGKEVQGVGVGALKTVRRRGESLDLANV